METVQLQCGSCNKLMAISTQHLGGQVRCPHCQAVVQAPPRPQQASVPATVEFSQSRVEAGEVESIFSPPAPTEDLFDSGPPRSLVEMPAEPPAAPGASAPPPPDGATVAAQRPSIPESTEILSESPAADGAADLTAVDRPRAPVDRGYWSLMMLIFLVPYSIMMTLFVIYLWYLADQKNSLDPLLDPSPRKDGARQVERPKHDMPLAKNLKVPIGGTIRVGVIEITPTKVQRDEFGNLELVLHAKNISTDQAFSPMCLDFLKTGKGISPPYTFVETHNFKRLYGGDLGFDRGGNGQTLEGDLQPGQAEDVILTTRHDKDVVKRILESPNEDVIWRVQVRRGLVTASRGGRVSATAVIGVTFRPNEVVKGG